MLQSSFPIDEEGRCERYGKEARREKEADNEEGEEVGRPMGSRNAHSEISPECEAPISLIDIDETSLYLQGGLKGQGIGWVL